MVIGHHSSGRRPSNVCFRASYSSILPAMPGFFERNWINIKASPVYGRAYSIYVRSSSKFPNVSLASCFFHPAVSKEAVAVLFPLDTDGIEFVKAVVKPLFNVSLEIISLPLMSSRSVKLSFLSGARPTIVLKRLYALMSLFFFLDATMRIAGLRELTAHLLCIYFRRKLFEQKR